MALQQQIKTKAEWVTFFLEADIPQVESDTYHHIYQQPYNWINHEQNW